MPWVEILDPPKPALRRIHEMFGGRVKYLVDESLGDGIYQYIRSLGHNARFGPDLGLHSAQEVFARGWSDKRVILTHSLDFLNDRQFPFNRNPGVIVMPGAIQVPDNMSKMRDVMDMQEAVQTVLNTFGRIRHFFPHPKICIKPHPKILMTGWGHDVWCVSSRNRKTGGIDTATYSFKENKTCIYTGPEW
jgi:hypothetical protein